MKMVTKITFAGDLEGVYTRSTSAWIRPCPKAVSYTFRATAQQVKAGFPRMQQIREVFVAPMFKTGPALTATLVQKIVRHIATSVGLGLKAAAEAFRATALHVKAAAEAFRATALQVKAAAEAFRATT